MVHWFLSNMRRENSGQVTSNSCYRPGHHVLGLTDGGQAAGQQEGGDTDDLAGVAAGVHVVLQRVDDGRQSEDHMRQLATQSSGPGKGPLNSPLLFTGLVH